MIKVLEKGADLNAAIASGNVVVDFNATWCGPCRMMGQIFKSIENDYADITFLSVDVDVHPELASQYGVTSIPCMFFYKDGKKIAVTDVDGVAQSDYLLGSRPEDDFCAILDNSFHK